MENLKVVAAGDNILAVNNDEIDYDWGWEENLEELPPLILAPHLEAKKVLKKIKPLPLNVKPVNLIEKLRDYQKTTMYVPGCDAYLYPPALNKEEELESNLIRIDLDKAAKELAIKEFELHNMWNKQEITEESEEFLKAYDKYYDILFKSKS